MKKRDEPVRLTRIYTRGGDRGETSLGDGSRVSKLDPLVRAYGAVDELNSFVGWVRVEVNDPRLERVQNELFDLGADLSVPYEEGDEKLRPDLRGNASNSANEWVVRAAQQPPAFAGGCRGRCLSLRQGITA